MINYNENNDCKCKSKSTENVNSEEISENRACSNDRKQNEMMMQIRELSFSVIELAQYLDTHENDQKALCLHNHYVKTLKELKDKYQKVYGPLTINYPCNKWRWIEEPWPWERGNN